MEPLKVKVRRFLGLNKIQEEMQRIFWSLDSLGKLIRDSSEINKVLLSNIANGYRPINELDPKQKAESDTLGKAAIDKIVAENIPWGELE